MRYGAEIHEHVAFQVCPLCRRLCLVSVYGTGQSIEPEGEETNSEWTAQGSFFYPGSRRVIESSSYITSNKL